MSKPQGTAAKRQTSSVVLDALPYADGPVSEKYEEYALSLVEEEMKKSAAPRLAPLPSIRFRSSTMKSEYTTRGSNRPPLDFLFNNTLPPTPGDEAKAEEWKEAVKKARVAHEKERVRAIVLEVEKDARVAQQWNKHNGTLSTKLELQQESLANKRQKVQDINMRRQQTQQQAGKKIRVLEMQYYELIKKQQQLHGAIQDIEQELQLASS